MSSCEMRNNTWAANIKSSKIKCSNKDSSIEALEQIYEQTLTIFQENHQVKMREVISKASNSQTPKQLEMRIRLRKKLEKKKISKS
jgi:hypothetical protein